MLKKIFTLCLAVIFLSGCAETKVGIKKESKKEEMPSALFLDDFDTAEKPNKFGGDSGTWNKDPEDLTQGCIMSFDGLVRYGEKGFSLKLDYDVDSPNPAYCGYWSRLQDKNLSKYKYLVFSAKGDDIEGYTTKFMVELKNAKQKSKYIVSGINNNWQRFKIPLSEFKEITDWTSMKEFVITFDDATVTNKRGGIYIDEIYFLQ
ncbi:MAG: hypothetical protein FJZ16_01720 [Candidatus Omnitrophica bacterium]|nr:hypothetical protein [Candidatus Omnitrophota bacterium]